MWNSEENVAGESVSVVAGNRYKHERIELGWCGRGEGRWMNWRLGLDIYTQSCEQYSGNLINIIGVKEMWRPRGVGWEYRWGGRSREGGV